MEIFRHRVPVVEAASIDEAYLDLSHAGSLPAAEAICRELKAAIRNEEQLTVSVGLGPSKLVAKIASGLHKPDGLTVVPPETVESFLGPLSIRVIPGIGPKTEADLMRHRVTTVQELRSLSRERLQEQFGRRGADLYEKARGRDDTPVSTEWQPKSIGEQETFERDTRETAFLMNQLRMMCQNVMHRLHGERLTTFRTIVLTVRFEDFTTTTRSHSLASPTSDARSLQAEALKLFLPFLDRRCNPNRKPFRLIGIRIERLN